MTKINHASNKMRPAIAAACVLAALLAGSAVADDKPNVTGLFLTTPYPALTVRAGEPATIDLALHNYGLPPQSVSLTVTEADAGWKATVLGGGQPVAAATVQPNAEQRLELKLEPPAGAKPGTYRFVVEATSDSGRSVLPLSITLGQELPAKLKLSSSFPALRGTARSSFKYRLDVANDSGRDAVINLNDDAPQGFQITFAEAYNTQQITSLPIEAGKSKSLDVAIEPPAETAAGNYDVTVHAESGAARADIKLALAIVGQPKIAISGDGGRLSGSAYVGEETSFPLQLRNDGSAAARDVALSATTPDGWKAAFDPTAVPEIAPGQTRDVKVLVTPSNRAIAGDYQVTFRADGGGAFDTANFRVTVMTSTLWGTAGIAVIAAALVVVMIAVARFGRR